jgi:hypothetical protein
MFLDLFAKLQERVLQSSWSKHVQRTTGRFNTFIELKQAGSPVA